MYAVKKRRHPANDASVPGSFRLSWVSLPRSYWTGIRVFILLLLGAFLGLTGFLLLRFEPETAKPVVHIATPQQPKTFDITLSEAELAPSPPAQVAALAKVLPPKVLQTKRDVAPPISPPALEVSVEADAKDATRQTTIHERAAFQDSLAQAFLQQDDLNQALRAQHQAAELDPANMFYRLELAILHDRAGDASGALQLYHQVVEAYDAQDASLPRDAGIGDIRRRLIYLESREKK